MRTLGESPQLARINGWFSHALYSHLPLWAHLGLHVPSRIHASPEDRWRLNEQRNTSVITSEGRWAYSRSYEMGMSFVSPDATTTVNGIVIPTITQAETHWQYYPSTATPLGHRTLDEVRFPSHKAHMWDSHQRDLGRRVLFHSKPNARVPVLTVDGSVGLRSAAATNLGFNPAIPTSPNPILFAYAPGAHEPPVQGPYIQEIVMGRMRWTRWGLRGRDFNGPEATAP